MGDAKERPPPGANRGRASKERAKNRVPSLPRPHNRRQLGNDGSPALEAALERDCEYFRLNPLVKRVRRRRDFYYRLSGSLAHALLTNTEIQPQVARVDQQFRP
jgi:hypothetical protein